MVATFREGGLVAWAEASGKRRTSGRAGGGLRFAFYGRVSTEDWQDPGASRARQRDQAEALVRAHGHIVAEFVDEGEPAGGVGAPTAGGGAGRPARRCVPGLGRDRGRGVRRRRSSGGCSSSGWPGTAPPGSPERSTTPGCRARRRRTR